MKNDAEFLKGVYAKAESLSKEKEKYKYNKYIKYSSVAALFILIPILLLQNIINNNEPSPIEQPSPISQPRTMSFGNIDYSFSNAEYILKGSVVSKTSDDDYVELKLSIDEKLFGNDINNEIIAYGSKEIVNFLSDGTDVVVFLYEQDGDYFIFNDSEGILIEHLPNTYIDIFGNEYSIEDITKNIDRSR
ncbi:MAG: hypothetical protein EWM50_07330 [Gottschalkiaceae bacterium]|nr:MAG: hypothetical protein EWM50_07330 [Gottschalkiaceae bacterium]